MLAVIGLGANLGDRLGTLRLALERLLALPGLVEHVESNVYDTDPVAEVPQPNYLNAAVCLAFADAWAPGVLVDRLLAIEHDLGRQRDGGRDLPRTIDLDLLWTDGPPSDDPLAIVPHPRLHLRAFALRPLLDVVPFARDPQGRLYAEHLASLGGPAPRRFHSGFRE